MCPLCGGDQMPNGDYCRLFHLNIPQERKRLKQFYVISLISKTYVQVAWDEVQNINNKVPTQPVHRMLKTPQNTTNQPNKTPPSLHLSLWWISLAWFFRQGPIPWQFLTHLFWDLKLQIEPRMVSAASPHPLEKRQRQTGREGKEMNCLNLILACTLISHIFFIS